MNLLNEKLGSIRRRITVLNYQIKEAKSQKERDKLVEQKEDLVNEETKILKQLGVLYDDGGYE